VAPQVFLTRRELRAMQAKADAAAALVEPEPTVADPAALTDAISDFDALARAAEATQSIPVDPTPAPVEAAPTQAFPFIKDEPANEKPAEEPSGAPAPSLESLLAPDPFTGQTPSQAAAPDLSSVPDTSEPVAFQWGIPASNAALPTPVSASEASDATSEALVMPHADESSAPTGSVAAMDDLLAEAAPEAVVEPEAPAKPERKRGWPFGRTKPVADEEPAAAEPTAQEETPAQAPADRWAGLATPSVAAATNGSVDSATPAAFNFGLTPQSTPEAPAAAPFVEPAFAEKAPSAEPTPSAEPVEAPAPDLSLPSLPTPGPVTSDWAAPSSDDGLTPAFVEPPATNSTYAPPAGHWSRQAELDDEEQPFENTLSREVGGGNVATTTSALILPQIPQPDYTTGLNTGETLVTGTIDLPQSFGTMGGDARRYDNADVDHILDAFDSEVVSTDSAPVRATRAVSTHTSTHGVINSAKPRSGNRLLTVLIISAGVLAVGVVGLLIASFVIN